jgi:hypothetical protein
MNRVHKLVPTATGEIVNAPGEHKKAQSYKLLTEHLPFITCDCGAQILLVPDLRAMSIAIKAHVAEHTRGKVNTSRNISQLLSQLALIKISEITDIQGV